MIFESLRAPGSEQHREHADAFVEFFAVSRHGADRLDLPLQVVRESLPDDGELRLPPRLHEVIAQFRKRLAELALAANHLLRFEMAHVIVGRT